MTLDHTVTLTDEELITRLTRAAQDERETTVALIVHLAEFDTRRLFEPAGFSSTFRYCQVVLRLSEDAACNRIEAARAARRFPIILDMLAEGSLSPTTVRMLARHLTIENHHALLSAASGRSKQEIEKLLAGLFPQPDVPSTIRVIRAAPPITNAAPVTSPATLADRAVVLPTPVAATPPMVAERYEIRFTI